MESTKLAGQSPTEVPVPDDAPETVGSRLAKPANWVAPAAAIVALAIQVSTLTQPQQLIATALLIVIAVLSFLIARRRSRDRRSRLVDATKLNLQAADPKHLWGREVDKKELQRFCESHVTVILDGESGAGKSALVQAGLIPELLATSFLFPVLVDQLGAWESVPEMLADILWNRLSDEQKRRLVQSADDLPSQPPDILSALESFHERLGRRPLLVFDQLDGFVLENLSHFQSPGGGWIGANSLTNDPFWHGLAELVCRKADPVHCLFVLGKDLMAVSHSFRFGNDVKAFTIGPLDPGLLEAYLTSLTGHDVISNQSNGWTDLRPELVKDLKRAGLMPGQIAFGLRSLAAFERPTLAEYRKVGRLRGMEARYLEDLIDQAAGQSHLQPEKVRCILARLAGVDSDAGASSSQSVPHAVSRLVDACSIPDASITMVLRFLRHHRIVRPVFDGASLDLVWALDHDYLCSVVAELALMTSRWRRRLKAASDAFNGATPPWNLFRLAPIYLQVALAWLWIWRRFRYRDLASYARLSLLRFSWLLVVALIGAAILSHMRAEVFKALLADWELPVDLYDVQSQLDTLTLPSCVTRFDWLASSVTHLQIAKMKRPNSSDRQDLAQREVQFPAWLVSLEVGNLPSPLRSLQALPRNLTYLNVSGDSQLTSFSGLPNKQLTHLAASGDDEIRFSAPLPASLQCLELGGQHLTSLPEQLPASLVNLRSLRLEGTHLVSLRGLPDSLRSLDLSVNSKLPQVDYLPPLLSELRIDAAKVSGGVRLPLYLKDLHLSRTSLADFSGLPAGLEALTLSTVEVGDWKGMPPSLRSLTLINMRVPELPTGLETLAVQLPAGDLPFEKLPPRLSVLRLSLTGAKDLRALPKNLDGLAITNTTLATISGCPTTVKKLDLRGTRQLRLISELPHGLVSLNLMNSVELEVLENLPASLRFLNVAGTRLAKLPKLPSGLEELDISGTAVQSLEGLPGGLRVLTVSRGQLRDLRHLPRSVRALRFVEVPEDRDGREGSHFGCNWSDAPFERWHCMVPR